MSTAIQLEKPSINATKPAIPPESTATIKNATIQEFLASAGHTSSACAGNWYSITKSISRLIMSNFGRKNVNKALKQPRFGKLIFSACHFVALVARKNRLWDFIGHGFRKSFLCEALKRTFEPEFCYLPWIRETGMKPIIALFAALLMTPLMSLSATAQSNYKIKPGDVVRVEVLEDASINRDSLVLPDGRISIPLAGTVRAGGQTVDQIRSEVASKLSPNFASEPTVFVTVSRLAEPRAVAPSGPAAPVTDTIYILGEVNNPGMVELERGTTLLQALAAVGGFSPFAATRRIQLRRTDKSHTERIYNVNYDAILQGKTSIGTTILTAGDVIIVPQRRLFE